MLLNYCDHVTPLAPHRNWRLSAPLCLLCNTAHTYRRRPCPKAGQVLRPLAAWETAGLDSFCKMRSQPKPSIHSSRPNRVT